ncbi:MAG: hypothetical protein ACPHDP_04935 [Pseudohongiellaceae bacterium]
MFATAMLSLVSDEEVVSGAGFLYFSLFATIPMGHSLYRRTRFAVSPVSLENSVY